MIHLIYVPHTFVEYVSLLSKHSENSRVVALMLRCK